MFQLFVTKSRRLSPRSMTASAGRTWPEPVATCGAGPDSELRKCSWSCGMRRGFVARSASYMRSSLSHAAGL